MNPNYISELLDEPESDGVCAGVVGLAGDLCRACILHSNQGAGFKRLPPRMLCIIVIIVYLQFFFFKSLRLPSFISESMLNPILYKKK